MTRLWCNVGWDAPTTCQKTLFLGVLFVPSRWNSHLSLLAVGSPVSSLTALYPSLIEGQPKHVMK
jgi:hypothetical protein